MPKNHVDVSIVIVYYKIKKDLFVCLDSVLKTTKGLSYEIIVVDNDEEKTIEKELVKKFPQVLYVPNHVNNGWGGGTNVGAAHARGEYLYFLNPDTIVQQNAIAENLQFVKTHKRTGIVSSLLLDKHRKPYPLQGTAALTPIRALIAYSALNKKFPKNPVSNHFWYLSRDRSKPFVVDIAPLSASLIKKSLFERAGKFDEKYFLYFEEYDLGRSIAQLGYRNYINTNSRVIHFWEGSTKSRNDTDEIMSASRRVYFRKYYGTLIAHGLEFLLGLPMKARR